MSSAFEYLSVELVELVVALLNLDDTRSLRLVSRKIEQMASQGTFLKSFTHKDVVLSTKALQGMILVTGSGSLGCHLRHCTIVGMVQERTEVMFKEPGAQERLPHHDTEQLRLLVKAFGNLRQHSPKGGLDTLCLRVMAAQDARPSWQAVESAAGSTFNTSMAALERSALLVHEHLDVFGSIRGCSLSSEVFQHFSSRVTAARQVFSSLKKLTVSLSAPSNYLIINEDDQHNQEHSSEEKFDRQWTHSSGALRYMPWLLQSMPHLVSLDLHWYDIGNVAAAVPISTIPPELSDDAPSNSSQISLKDCTMSGFFATETDLLQLFEAIKPAHLNLEYIRLTSRAMYDPVFEYLAKYDCPVSSYHLDDLCKMWQLVHYSGVPGRAKFQYLELQVEPSTLTRPAGHTKKAIKYRYPIRGRLSSPQAFLWKIAKARKFVLPQFTYDLTQMNAPPK